jgi:hypothetical protein
MPYILTSDINLEESCILTIKAGTVVKLKGCNINVKGSLKSQGSVNNPIVFTSMQDDIHGDDTNNDKANTLPKAGDWGYIWFGDTSHDSVLDHCNFLYAGSRYAVIYLDTASPTIKNCVFEENKNYVIDMDLPSHPMIEGNTISKNGYNGINIREGSYSKNGYWDTSDMPYILSKDISLEESCTLTINPGVTVKLNRCSINVKGSLKSEGNSSNPITFTSLLDDIHGGDTNNDKANTLAKAGDWGYISFSETSHDSVIDFCQLLYGGSQGSVIHLSKASPTIQNCSFENNSNYVIDMDLTSHPVVSANSLSNNEYNGIHVRTGHYSTDAEWNCTNMPYILMDTENITFEDSCTLTIKPGVLVKIYGHTTWWGYIYPTATYHPYNINVKGVLRAQGTKENPIIFTSLRDDSHGGDTNNDGAETSPEASDWGTISFDDTSNSSTLEHCMFLYGGHSNPVISMEISSPRIANCIFENNRSAILCNAGSSPQMQGNVIRKCSSDTILCSDRSTPIINYNSIYDNESVCVNNTDENIVVNAKYNWWGNENGPMEGDISGGVDYEPYLSAPPESTPVTPPSNGTAVSQFRLNLLPGLNMISMPLKSQESYTARSLCNELDATTIIRFDAGLQTFESFVPDVFEGEGFPIDGGAGYIVNLLSPKEVVFTGSAWSNAPPKSAMAIHSEHESHWAFIVCGVVPDSGTTRYSDALIVVENLQTGNRVDGIIGRLESGKYSVVFVDPGKRDVINEGDTIRIQLKNINAEAISEAIIITVTPNDLSNGYIQANLPMRCFMPDRNALLQNYPNPFNPETWIPYQLGEDVNTVIRIYTSAGQLVRTLDLGHRPSGFYLDKNRAAYWDGRDEAGEKTASGVYFYTIHAGDFSSTHKMVMTR